MTDGRHARGERTRSAIIEAFLDLLGEGEPRPRARDIAARAGVSVRSIFQHFEDLEALRADVVAVQSARLRPLLDGLDPTGDRTDRIAALVAHRRRLYERVAPVRRSLAGIEPSPSFEAGLAALHQELRGQLQRQFRQELATLAAGPRRRRLDAIDALTSFEAWDQLRRTQGLGPAPAARCTADALDRLVP